MVWEVEGADEGVEREILKGAREGMAEQTASHDGKEAANSVRHEEKGELMKLETNN